MTAEERTKDFLKETSQQFKEKYDERLKGDLAKSEATERELRDELIDYFENTINDLMDPEGSSDGYSRTGIYNFLLACKVVEEIGWKKFYYATKRKIEFLRSLEISITSDLTLKNADIVQDDRTPEYSSLLKALSRHINGINADEFTNIIKNHQLTPGTPKAKWIGLYKSEAAYFADKFNFTMPEFNNCFTFSDGKKLKPHNRPTKKPFTDLLEPYIK